MAAGIINVVSDNNTFNLVGDIGATNARFSLVPLNSSDLKNIKKLPCNDFETFQDAISFYLSSFPEAKIHSACFATAGTVHLESFKLANNHWYINKQDVSSVLKNVDIHWVNDFTAQALATTVLTANDIIVINPGHKRPESLRLAIGPGTGLGVCGLAMSDGSWVPIMGEGGHVDLPSNSNLQVEVLSLLSKKYGHVSVERVLSGPGIVNLYSILCQINGEKAQFNLPAEISVAATSANPDQIAFDTLQLFCSVFGSVAGNAALNMGAIGGVYITSDLVRNFLDLFLKSEFQQSFESKGRLQSYMAEIPVYLSIKDNMGLLGTVHVLNHK